MDLDLPLEYVYVDPERPPDDGEPGLVAVLHGRGADERDLLPVAREAPDEYAVLSLRAPERLGPGYTWYELDLSGGGLESSQPGAGFERSLDRVAEAVAAAVDAGHDADRVGLLGFSQGGILALSLLFEDPEPYRWVVALHCYLPGQYDAGDAPAALADRPVFVGAGTRDEVIPAGRAEDAADRLRSAGADVTVETHEAGHGVARAELSAVAAFLGDVA